MKKLGWIMRIIATMIYCYKFYDEYPFKYDKDWILLIFFWGLSMFVIQFFIEFNNVMKE